MVRDSVGHGMLEICLRCLGPLGEELWVVYVYEMSINQCLLKRSYHFVRSAQRTFVKNHNIPIFYSRLAGGLEVK